MLLVWKFCYQLLEVLLSILLATEYYSNLDEQLPLIALGFLLYW